jgi:hypothetical protein
MVELNSGQTPPEDPRETIRRLVKQQDQIVKDLARDGSAARLLAENEPFGEKVIYSLVDDALPYNDLWARLKIISDWLKETEERYSGQFPSGRPSGGNRYDLSRTPEGFKSRLDIFKEIVERWESNALMDTRIVFEDPIVVIKRIRTILAQHPQSNLEEG